MNKLEMWNAYTVLKRLRDILASFLFSLLLCQTLIFPLPPSASGFRQGSDSNNRPVSGQTKLGSISIHFQGAATAVRERVRVEKEWGGGVYARYGGRSVEGAKPDMTVEKQSRIQEEIERRCPWLNSVLVFGKLFEFGSEFVFLYFSVCSSSCFLFLFTASRGGGGVICLH